MVTTTDRRTQRAVQKRSERRDAILRAAERVFCVRGYPDASIADVIDAAQISRGTFYLYFDGKDALYLELIERFTGLVTEALEVVDPEDEDPAKGVLENVQRVVDMTFRHPELTLLVLRESRGLNQAIDQRLDRLYDFLHDMVEGVLAKGASSGMTRKVVEPVIATALIGAFKEVFMHHLTPNGPRNIDREVLAAALFEFGAQGLWLPKPTSNRPPAHGTT